MDIIKQIISNPIEGLILFGFVAAFGGLLSLLVWGLLAGIRWATRGRDVKVLGVELKDDQPDAIEVERRRGPAPDEILKAIKGAVWISSKIESAKRSIVTAQKDAIAGRRPSYFAAVQARGVPAGFARIFLVEFEDVFQIAAEFNHVAEHVDPEIGFVDSEYLDKKLASLGSRYTITQKELAAEPSLACTVPWAHLEPVLRETCRLVLFDFAALSEPIRQATIDDIRTIKENLGVSEAIAQFIDEVVTDIDK